MAPFFIPYAMEGIWTIAPDQTTTIPRARAVCLSHDRWAALDWQDSAVSPLIVDGKVPLCKEFLNPKGKALSNLLSKNEPLLFSFSARIDRGLYHFWDNQNNHITTSKVMVTAEKVTLTPSTTCDYKDYKHYIFIGAIPTSDLSQYQKDGFEQDQPQHKKLTPLRSYAKPNQCSRVTLTDKIKNDGNHTDLNGYAANGGEIEGYLFPVTPVTPEATSGADRSTEDRTLYLRRDSTTTDGYFTDSKKRKLTATDSWLLGHLVRRVPVPEPQMPSALLWRLTLGATPIEELPETGAHAVPGVQAPGTATSNAARPAAR